MTFWTPSRVATLRDLWSAQFSIDDIAASLGCPRRNVLMKLSALGLYGLRRAA